MFLGIALVFLGAWIMVVSIIIGVIEMMKTSFVPQSFVTAAYLLGGGCTVLGTIITGVAYFV
jgi:hypothetical protein